MKLIAFILSAYLLFLIAVPCCSFDNCPEENTVQAQNHEKENGDCGSCSPFFTCSGCSGFTVAASEMNAELIPFIPNTQYPSHNVALMPKVDFDFWQPPKLG